MKKFRGPSALPFLLAALVMGGCVWDQTTNPLTDTPTPTNGEQGNVIPEFSFPKPDNETQSIGAYTSIAWPFVGDSPNNWRNWNCENYPCGGSMGWFCGDYIHTHSGADHYARDLSRIDGSSFGKNVHAGLSGRVVRVRHSNVGYGNEVVIHYPQQRLCIRYAHLSEIAVSEGQQVTIRQRIGKVGNSGCGNCAAHLHLVVYENVATRGDGWPQYIPSLCNRDNWHACRVFFFS